jgi:hypothetical protein
MRHPAPVFSVVALSFALVLGSMTPAFSATTPAKSTAKSTASSKAPVYKAPASTSVKTPALQSFSPSAPGTYKPATTTNNPYAPSGNFSSQPPQGYGQPSYQSQQPATLPPLNSNGSSQAPLNYNYYNDSTSTPSPATAAPYNGGSQINSSSAGYGTTTPPAPAAYTPASPYGSSGGGYSFGGGATPANTPMLQGRVSTVPAGTQMTATVASNISSQFARVGDNVRVTLATPLIYAGSMVLPAGTTVDGQVANVISAAFTGRNGELDIRFNRAMLPTGQIVNLDARVATTDASGVVRGGSNKERLGKAALNTGIGAGLGAALGTAMGPLSGGSVGKGAIYGTALGAGIGAAKAIGSKGQEAQLTQGTAVSLVLNTPATLPQVEAPPTGGSLYQGASSTPAYNNPSNYYSAPAQQAPSFYTPSQTPQQPYSTVPGFYPPNTGN